MARVYRDHFIEITATSVSKQPNGDEVVNSETIHREFAADSKELVAKAMGLTRGATDGVFAAAEKLAAPYK